MTSVLFGLIIFAAAGDDICLREGDVVGIDEAEMARIRSDLVNLAGTVANAARLIEGQETCPQRTLRFSLLRAGNMLQVGIKGSGPGGRAEESWTEEIETFPGPRMARVLQRLWPRGAKAADPVVEPEVAPEVPVTAPEVSSASQEPEQVAVASQPPAVQAPVGSMASVEPAAAPIPWGPIALGGVSVVAASLGTWYGLDARHHSSEVEARGPGSQTHIAPGRTSRARANVAWAVAGTALVSAVLWWWLDGDSDPDPTP